jgi:anti-sigma-K factor RskA
VSSELEAERVSELLMQRATGALSAPEAAALDAALAKLPAGEVARWELAAAELTAALASTIPDAEMSLPPALAEKVIGTGEALVRSQPRAISAPRPQIRSRANPLAWAGWMAAAAAMVLWIATPRTSTPSPVESVAVSASRLRDSLLARDSAVQKLAWTATKDSAALGASGDVVWSARNQAGVMRIAGLQPNDRRRWQYQLWIFDKTRDQKYPVDGGVFDVPAGTGEILVPIDARVPVGDAVMFAITVEPAGGVVVSTRERIALLAQRGG